MTVCSRNRFVFRLILIVIIVAVSNSFAAAQMTPPQYLKIEVKSATHNTPGLYITWQHQTPENSHFVLQRNWNDGNWVEMKLEKRFYKWYLDQAVAPNTNYCYRVKIERRYFKEGSGWVNAESDFTAPVCYMTPTIPSRPENMTGKLDYPEPGKAKYTINWQDMANNEKAYEVEISGLPDRYLDANANAFSMTRAGNTCPETSFRVRAYNLYYSPYSTKVTLVPKPDLIPAPQNLKADDIEAHKVRLAWFNPTNYQKIRIERKDLGKVGGFQKKELHLAPQFKHLHFLSGGFIPAYYIDESVEPSHAYEYRIKGQLNVGESSGSNVVAVKTPVVMQVIPQQLIHPVPDKPMNLSGRLYGPDKVKLTWFDSSKNETGFKIEYRQGNALTFKPLATVARNSNNYLAENLSPATRYVFIVRAFNGNGQSQASNNVIITTPKGKVKAPAAIRGRTSTDKVKSPLLRN